MGPLTFREQVQGPAWLEVSPALGPTWTEGGPGLVGGGEVRSV